MHLIGIMLGKNLIGLFGLFLVLNMSQNLQGFRQTQAFIYSIPALTESTESYKTNIAVLFVLMLSTDSQVSIICVKLCLP